MHQFHSNICIANVNQSARSMDREIEREMDLLGRVRASIVASGRRQRGGGTIWAGGSGVEVTPSGRRWCRGGSVRPGGGGVEATLSRRTWASVSTSSPGAGLARAEEDRCKHLGLGRYVSVINDNH
jgi:hypothetical protein